MDNCKFSHLADERRADLERIVKEKQKVREDKTRALEDRDPEKTLSEWLSKRSKTDDQNVNEVNIVSEAPLLPGYEIPPHVAQLQNPPPSVLPPPTDVLRGLSFVDWGWVSLWELCSFQWNSKFSVCCKMILVSLFLCIQKKKPDPWNKHNNTRCCYIFAMSIFIHTSINNLKFVVSESLSLETVIYMYKQCD